MGLRPSKTATAAIALALVSLALAASLAALAGSPAPSAAPTSSGRLPIAPSSVTDFQPSFSPHPAAQSATLTLQNLTLPAFTRVPSVIGLSLSTFNVTVTPANTNASITMFALLSPTTPHITLPFATWPIAVTQSGQTNFSTTLNDTNVFAHEASWVSPYPSWPSGVRYFFSATVWINVGNASAPSYLYGNATNTNSSHESSTQVVGNNPWAALDSPTTSTSGAVSPGNVTVAVSYSGDYVTGANVSFYNAAKVLVYGADVTSLQQLSAQTGNVTVVANAAWLAVTPGTYNATVTLTTLYGNPWAFTFSFVVEKAVGPSSTVYVNQTAYSNATGASSQIISGWSPGATAALLLVIGVIVGMVVALVLGRMMWGTPPTPPAQAWSGSKTATNECPICHQSFATEDEMKEHQKTAHGM